MSVISMISIIVPVYNAERYLDKCLTSLLHQDYYAIEIVLVDNGSTDGSFDLCQNYAKKDPRVRVYKQVDGNQGAARNYGIEKARGTYLMFVDSDDYVSERFCSTAMNSLNALNADITIFDYFTVKDGVSTPQRAISKQQPGIVAKEVAIKSLIKESFSCNKIFKKELFNNIKYPADRNFEDILTVYRLVELANTITYINVPLYFYVHHDNSITNSGQHMDELLTSSLNLYTFIKNNYPAVYEDDELQSSLVELALFYYSKGSRDNKVLRERALCILKHTNVTPKVLTGKSKFLLYLLRHATVIGDLLLDSKRIVRQ